MTESDLLEQFGLFPRQEDIAAIRSVLREAVARERSVQGEGDTELMRLCCVYLFVAGEVGDSLEVWRAKTASMDADASIDVQLLCGAGHSNTKAFLSSIHTDEAKSALGRLIESETTGDFEGFSVPHAIEDWRQYYS